MMELSRKLDKNTSFFSDEPQSVDESSNIDSGTEEVNEENEKATHDVSGVNIDENINFETGEYIGDPITESPKRPFLSTVFDIIEVFSYAVALMVVVFLFVIKFVTVDGTSMLNTLHHEDRLIVYNLFYTPEVNDVIVINYDEKDELLVKRVIGVGGDTVKINFSTWEIWVNDELIDQYYLEDNYQLQLGENMKNGNLKMDDNNCATVVVEQGKVFVMGDNRNGSLDSREIGQLDEDEIMGKVILRVFPLDKAGTVK